VLHAIHMPIAMNPLNTRPAAINARIPCIVFTSFFRRGVTVAISKER
jgi:hypothetical protein